MGNLRAVKRGRPRDLSPQRGWHEMPAAGRWRPCAPQAVAARTYALRQRKPLAAFDLKATVSSQVTGTGKVEPTPTPATSSTKTAWC